MAFLQQENEFLKVEIEAYKQELTRAREAYERELNLYTLAHVASAAENSAEKEIYEEYMCSQCGDLYAWAGYKVVETPLPRPTPASTPVIIKKECPAVTQEPVGPSIIYEEEDKLKLLRPTLVVKIKNVVPKSVNTADTQTEPPEVQTIFTQTLSMQELSKIWKTEYAVSQGRAFQAQNQNGKTLYIGIGQFWNNSRHNRWKIKG